jgi:hypothetical protein
LISVVNEFGGVSIPGSTEANIVRVCIFNQISGDTSKSDDDYKTNIETVVKPGATHESFLALPKTGKFRIRLNFATIDRDYSFPSYVVSNSFVVTTN